jgi:hypothetical protein
MKCTRCGWPSSFRERGLFSGLCAECRGVAAGRLAIAPGGAAALAVSIHAARCLELGESAAQVQQKLIDAGQTADAASSLMHEITARCAALALARALLDDGSGLIQVRAKLIENGIAPEEAADIVDKVQEERSGVGVDGSPPWRRNASLPPAQVALLAVSAVVFSILFLAGCAWSFASGGVPAVGYLVAQVGQIWLLILMVRECRPDAVGYALLIPFFTWYFAARRWDIAKLPFLLSFGGVVVTMLGAK